MKRNTVSKLLLSALICTPCLTLAGSPLEKKVANIDAVFKTKFSNVKTVTDTPRTFFNAVNLDKGSASNLFPGLAYVRKNIGRIAVSRGLDENILAAVLAVTYDGRSLKTAKEQTDALNLLVKFSESLHNNLVRYDGNYKIALEATSYEPIYIDYLYLRYGDDLSEHLEDIYKLNGEQIEGADSFSTRVFARFGG